LKEGISEWRAFSVKRQKENIIEVIGHFLILLILPTLMVSISGIVMSFLVPGNSEWVSLFLIIGVSMTVGFILFPYAYLKKLYQVKREELGVRSVQYLEIIIGCITLIFLYSYLFSKGIDFQVLILSTVQMCIVAVTEEFWARGAMCYIIRKLSNRAWFVVLLSSICFAFVTHMNEPFMDNVLYRLPGSIVMGVIYVKTNNLRYTVLFHFTYNLLNI